MTANHLARTARVRLLVLVVAVLGACGSDGDSSADDQNTDSCGPATCDTGEVCCDHCSGTCVPEESGVQCPDDTDPGRDCDESGASLCSDQPPSFGDDCPEMGLYCTYQRCDDEGVITASCASGGWEVTVAACEPVSCGGDLCPGGQICLQRFSGAQLTECADNPCGVDSLDCDCADSLCGDLTCSTAELTVTCTVQCTPGNCPP